MIIAKMQERKNETATARMARRQLSLTLFLSRKMHSLLSYLPDVISLVCQEWLELIDLVSLDSACSTRGEDRTEVLHRALTNPLLKYVVLTRDLTLETRVDSLQYIEWVRKRGCRLAPVFVELDIDATWQLTHQYPFVGDLTIDCNHKSEAVVIACLKKCFDVFPRLTGLSVLSLEITRGVMQCLTNAPAHIQLKVFTYNYFSKQASRDSVLLSFLARYRESLEIFCGGDLQLSLAVLGYMCRHCSQLQELELSNSSPGLSSNITRDQFGEAMLHCRSLRSFNIWSLRMQLTAEEVCQMAINNPHLETFQISGTLIGRSAIAIFRHCLNIDQIMSANICYNRKERPMDTDYNEYDVMHNYSVPKRAMLAHGSYATLTLGVSSLHSSFTSAAELRDLLEALPALHSVAFECFVTDSDEAAGTFDAIAWIPAAWSHCKHLASLETISLQRESARFAASLLQIFSLSTTPYHLVVDYSSKSSRELTQTQIGTLLMDPLCTYGQSITNCHLCHLPELTGAHLERLLDALPKLSALRVFKSLTSSPMLSTDLLMRIFGGGIELLD